MPAERMRRGSLAGLRIAPFKASSFDAIHRVMVAEPASKATRPLPRTKCRTPAPSDPGFLDYL
jgi:hypothetical protein